MATKLGTSDISDLKLGSAQVDKLYLGTTQVWPTYAPMSNAVASPSTTSGTEMNWGIPLAHVKTSTPVEATVSGGATPKTYSWARVSGSTDIAPTAPSSNLTHFEGDVTAAQGTSNTISAVFRCTIDDGVGNIDTNNVTVNLTHDRTI